MNIVQILKSQVIREGVIGVDIGLLGGISHRYSSVATPIVKNEIKPARYIFARDERNRKIVIKTGPNKGQFKKKQVSKAKYKEELDCKEIEKIFAKIEGHATTVVLEEPGNSIGNSAGSTATTSRNYGKFLAIAELCEAKIKTVPASKWKKDLGIGKDKLECVEYAEKLSGSTFRTPKGRLLDGQAEAFLIAYWYTNFSEEN